MKNPHILNRLNTFTFQWGVMPIAGLQVLYVFDPLFGIPAGFVWFTGGQFNHHICIGYIFVHEYYRRHGLAAMLLERLRNAYPTDTICTAAGNELSTPWLQAMNFQPEPAGWFLRPTLPEPCPMI